MHSQLSKIDKNDIARLDEANRKLFTAVHFACAEKIIDPETWIMVRAILFDWLHSDINSLKLFANIWHPIVESSKLISKLYGVITKNDILQFTTKNNLIVVVNANNQGFISKFFGKNVVTTVFVSDFNNNNLVVSSLYQISDTNAYDTQLEIHNVIKNTYTENEDTID
jgi:hypothetical protein